MAHLVIVGAGPGLSLSTARRFGAEGYDVTLLGRTRQRLDQVAAELAADGVKAGVQVADATDHAGLRRVLTDVNAASTVDVCVFQPGTRADELVDVRAATVDNVRPNLELLVLGAVAMGEALLPAMTERGAGALLFVGGGSARLALPAFGNLGMAMSGLRNYAMTLHKALSGSGVYAGFLTVAGMIATARAGKDEIDPAGLADRAWRMVTDGHEPEVLMTAGGEIPVKSSR
ncbi:MAG TPA: SDR family NAD(P)-dependent oxidoreductase [Amycolatopsis sp.]|nr:SDR family NAD(P)-dependent oxidoreductase [Amycolatopsis sp.]